MLYHWWPRELPPSCSWNS